MIKYAIIEVYNPRADTKEIVFVMDLILKTKTFSSIRPTSILSYDVIGTFIRTNFLPDIEIKVLNGTN